MHSASKAPLRKSRRSRASAAKTETEIKLRVRDLREILRRLARLGAKKEVARMHEMNTLYDTRDGRLTKSGQMLRVRVERRPEGPAKKDDERALLTYKGPANGRGDGDAGKYKVREERELQISDHEEMSKILEALGLEPSFRYEKFRTTYRLGGLKSVKVEVDETPIGTFLELEGTRGGIDRAAKSLGFSRGEYITKSYAGLLIEARGLGGASRNEPKEFSGLPDMVFSAGRKGSGRDA